MKRCKSSAEAAVGRIKRKMAIKRIVEPGRDSGVKKTET